ncbi:ABC transporter permease [Patescibacteria group bacterium]|nr:ABC transporter permease [Patescibacteria group bacterium]
MSYIRKFFSYRAANTLIVFVGLILIFSFFTPRHVFVNPRNITALSKLMPDLGIVALGIGMLMVCGEFDLSVSSVLPLCAFVFISLLKASVNPFFALCIALGAGAILGLLNGLITVKGHIPSFITTLGTMMFWRGILYVCSRMWPIGLRAYLPPGSLFERIFTGKIGGVVPVQMVWFIAFGVILGIILHSHRFGNWVYATGDNKEAARAMGINTDRVKTICFMIVSVLCAFVGILQLLRMGTFTCTQGIGFELKAIAASVVGGTFLTGGIGSIMGIFLGAITIQMLENGLILMRVPVFGISAFIGLAIILFVILNTYIERKRTK